MTNRKKPTLSLVDFVLLTVYFLIPYCTAQQDSYYYRNSLTYDFIIVGGGTAGCCLASRLSENGRFSVLLLEAGGVPPDFVEVPGFAKGNLNVPEITFKYRSVPQTRASLWNDGTVTIYQGKVLGGTSSINFMVYNRGSPHNFDFYANVTGNESWKYSNMLKYFKKAETYLGEFPSDQHGYDGPITVSVQHYAPGREEFLEAGRELGYTVNDPNGPQHPGFAPIEFAKRNGRRVSSYEGYVKPIQNSRPNLKIVLNAFVSNVIFAENKAIAVRYTLNDGGVRFAFASKEIILSAGTFGSSALLLRSGVGPGDVLRAAGVAQIKELPVGENLQDHPVVPFHFVLNNKSLVFDPATDLTQENYDLFQNYGEGPFSTVKGFAAQAFLVSSVARQDGFPDWSDMGIWLTSENTRHPLFKDISMASGEVTISAIPYLARCKSRGTVKLDPANVHGMPLIDFNYLGDVADEQIFIEAILTTLQLFEETEAYRKVDARYPTEPVKGCEHIEFRSLDYWKCYIRQTAIGGTHSTSTCAMNSVVDSNLKVYGIENLRICDGSVLPFISNSNLHAAIYGIAEKAADDILNDWII